MISNKNLKGISLITLVITIVVVIILAAAVLLSLSSNNPINNARIANVVEGKDDIESGVLAYTSKIKAKTLAEFETEDIILGNNSKIESNRIVEKGKNCKITINGEEITLYKLDEEKFKEQVGDLPRKPSSNSAWYLDKNGKVYLIFGSIDEVPNWMKNKEEKIDNATLNQFVVIAESAFKVAKNPNEYYGKVVENYNAQGLEWKIFHSDGENIYLITSEYIAPELLPEPATGGTKPLNTNTNLPKAAPLTNVLNGYSGGSKAIADDNPARKWLKQYFDYLSINNVTSDSSNIKATAYMLDSEKWNKFVYDEYANYAIGGPTLEMLFASYNKKYGTNYLAEVEDVTGYQISGGNWKLSTEDTLYLLPPSNISSTGANAMWIASPAVGAGDGNLMDADSNGGVGSNNYSLATIRFSTCSVFKV